MGMIGSSPTCVAPTKNYLGGSCQRCVPCFPAKRVKRVKPLVSKATMRQSETSCLLEFNNIHFWSSCQLDLNSVSSPNKNVNKF